MIPLTDERLRQLAYDDMVCIGDSGRAMAVELLAARGRITKLTGERDELRDSVRGHEAIRQHQADRIAALGRLARTLWDRRRQWQTDAIEVVTARARIAELEALADRVRAALSGHPRCELHPDTDPVSCGWKRAVADVQRALEVQS